MNRKVRLPAIRKRKRKQGHGKAAGHDGPLAEQIARGNERVTTRELHKRLESIEELSRHSGGGNSSRTHLRHEDLFYCSDDEASSQFSNIADREFRILHLATKQRLGVVGNDKKDPLDVNDQRPRVVGGRFVASDGFEIASNSEDSLSEAESSSILRPYDAEITETSKDARQCAEAALLQITVEEEEALAAFDRIRSEPPSVLNLADLVTEKLRERYESAQNQTENSDICSSQKGFLDTRVRHLYESVGEIMHRYRSGKVPKAFKMMPALRQWEEAMWLTRPERWSPQALLVATRAFASNLDPAAAQRFYTAVLLPRCREDITAKGKLNVHLYHALRKATYKPQAFYKGILFPLIEEKCTLREAAIFCSVLNRTRIPALHSAAALLQLACKPYSGPVALFIRVLLDKKYALPHRVVDALLEHFLKAREDKREYPVLWHQSLLAFVQYFKSELSTDQLRSLHLLIREKRHHAITPAIYREIFSSRNHGAENEPHPTKAKEDSMNARWPQKMEA
ncbi:hypothetical protein F1559_003943 [Cyanidiococcus yangmingshanensis]|uniref:Bystin n=1 Tax=Cyanidiococcus yangmingshanensis TaxID=2690220 RepID=A0A7J7INB4_9RHOD|nr:hypothetical protein F1559_003943 [Cyanidiococcus yangmingshanensis]